MAAGRVSSVCMKPIQRCLTLLAFGCLAVASTLSAQDTEGGAKPKRPMGPGGVVKSVEGSTITVENRKGETQTITVADTTAINQSNGDKAALSDIKPGMHVRAKVEGDKVEGIRIMPPKGKGEGKPKGPKGPKGEGKDKAEKADDAADE